MVSNINLISMNKMTESNQDTLNENASTDTLVCAFVIFRHGARNINYVFPNDKYKDEDEHWPEGFGQLTNEGKSQLYDLGKYLRRRYDKIIGRKYSPNKIYVQSTNHDRTLMSAQACLAGLYPPTGDEIWNKELLWQPIPVHSIPLSYMKFSSKHSIELENHMKESSEVKRIYKEYADHFKHWSQMSGLNIATIDNVYSLHKTLTIEKEQNKTLPDWAEEAIKPNGIMEYITTFNFKLCSITPQLAKLRSGILIKEIIERFSRKINSILQPDRSLWLYSAHDFTITNVLGSLGLFEPHIPAYAASLHFELYKSSENEHYLQICYRKSGEEHPMPMNIPGCGAKCSLNQFCKLYKEIIPGDINVDISGSH